jgi:hypothetical protein
MPEAVQCHSAPRVRVQFPTEAEVHLDRLERALELLDAVCESGEPPQRLLTYLADQMADHGRAFRTALKEGRAHG